jgi:chromosome segregation ATPase
VSELKLLKAAADLIGDIWRDKYKALEQQLEGYKEHANYAWKRVEELEQQLERISDDSLRILAGTVCTPIEGYRKAGFSWLIRDIKELCNDRDRATATIKSLNELLAKATFKTVKLADKIEDLERQNAKLVEALKSLQTCMIARSTVEGDLPWTTDVIAALDLVAIALKEVRGE